MYFASSNSIFIDFWHLRMRENGWYLKTNNGTLTECATKLNVLQSVLWAIQQQCTAFANHIDVRIIILNNFTAIRRFDVVQLFLCDYFVCFLLRANANIFQCLTSVKFQFTAEHCSFKATETVNERIRNAQTIFANIHFWVSMAPIARSQIRLPHTSTHAIVHSNIRSRASSHSRSNCVRCDGIGFNVFACAHNVYYVAI